MNKLKQIIYPLCLITIIVLIIINPNSKSGASNGLNLCLNIIIPALMPVLIITNIIIRTHCSELFCKIFGRFTTKVLRLPSVCTPTIILSLIGGYPTGAILVSHLYKNKLISPTDAKRLMRFCFCGGVAFIITSVGTIGLGNTNLGVILYLINIFVCIIIAIISSAFYPKVYIENKLEIEYSSFSDAVIEAVDVSIKSILNMSAYIILFSSLYSVFTIPNELLPIFEITNGIIGKHLQLNYICAFLCFGGFCIHLQLLPLLKNIKMKYTDFLIWRIISSLMCYAISSIYLKFFPQAINVFSNISTSIPRLYQVSNSLSIVMIISSVMLILDLDYKKHHLPI